MLPILNEKVKKNWGHNSQKVVFKAFKTLFATKTGPISLFLMPTNRLFEYYDPNFSAPGKNRFRI